MRAADTPPVADQIPDSAKLLPCPFCGGEASLTIPSEHVQADCADIYVSCDECEAEGQRFVVEMQGRTPDLWPYERRDAIAAWNTRAAPPAMDREAVEPAEAALLAFNGGMVRVPDDSNPRGYIDYYRPLDAMRRALSTLSADAIRQGEGKAFTGVEAWDVLVNVDDRTSPEEYPDMCLITRDELIDFMERATPASADNSSDDAGGDFACRFGGVEYSRSDLAIAQRAACGIVPLYGTGDHGEQDAAQNGKLWNDHPAVQGALRALHEARMAALPRITGTPSALAALEAIDRFVTDHVGNDDTCDGVEVDERAQKAVAALRAMLATPASHASDGGEA